MDKKIVRYLNSIKKKEGIGAAISAHAKIADKYDLTLGEAIAAIKEWQVKHNIDNRRKL